VAQSPGSEGQRQTRGRHLVGDLFGPVLSAALQWQDWQHPLYVLILYAVIVVVDGFLLQPYIMRRVARVPMWASILAPLVLGFVIPFWGFLLAPPLLAVIYAFKAKRITP